MTGMMEIRRVTEWPVWPDGDHGPPLLYATRTRCCLGNGRDGAIWELPAAEAFAKLCSFQKSCPATIFELRLTDAG